MWEMLVLATVAGICGPAIGQDARFLPLCAEQNGITASRHACIVERVRSTDGALNAEYGRLRDLLREPEASALVTGQRAWLRNRDRTCGVDARIFDREAWLAHISKSENRAACVVAESARRIDELRRMQGDQRAALMIGDVVPPLPRLMLRHITQPFATFAAEQRTRSSQGHRTGRHYFEVVIDETRGPEGSTVVSTAVVNGSRAVISDHRLEQRDLVLNPSPNSTIRIVGGNLDNARIPKVVLGWAVDLDAGLAYLHRNGEWLGDAPPGSGRGAALDQSAEAFAEVTTNRPLQGLLATGAVQVNFGSEPFSAFAPAGFRGFDWPEHLALLQASTAMPSSGPISLTAKADLTPLMVRFTEWIKSFPRGGEGPVDDASGERCGVGQAGDVWFLAGWGKGGTVRRTCVVPQGKPILVPVMNTVAQAPVSVPCDRLLMPLRKVSESASDVHFSLDGASFDKSRIQFAGTACFRIQDLKSGQPNVAATMGHWVLLAPLSPGRHVVQYGGRFDADGFIQDITYALEVR